MSEENSFPDIAMAYHSAAELMLYPYGYDYTVEVIENLEELVKICMDGIDALNLDNDSGRDFECINGVDLCRPKVVY